VDRTALGQQAIDAFHKQPLETKKPHAVEDSTTSRNLGGTWAAEAETRIQVATVQAMVQTHLIERTTRAGGSV